MDLELAGKVALVTGASQGVGYGIASMLAREGAHVAIAARREAALRSAAEAIGEDSGASVFPIQGDIRKPDDCARLVTETVKKFGSLTMLVNNDGAPPLGPALRFDDEAWRLAMERNLYSVIRMVREAVPHMQNAGFGSIVNIIAASVPQPRPGHVLTVSSWAAVVGAVSTMSQELGPEGVTINNIAIGPVDTPLITRVTMRRPEFAGLERSEVLEALGKDLPVRRVGRPEEVGALAAFLLSHWGSFITGRTILMDGGLVSRLI